MLNAEMSKHPKQRLNSVGIQRKSNGTNLWIVLAEQGQKVQGQRVQAAQQQQQQLVLGVVPQLQAQSLPSSVAPSPPSVSWLPPVLIVGLHVPR